MASQKVDGVERPVAFASRMLTTAEVNYAPTKGEALAIVFALKRFASLLLGEKVIMRTDHKPLSFLHYGSESNRKLARWWSELQSFNCSIEYVKGKSNLVPDCLSCLTTQYEEVATDAKLGHMVSVWGDSYHRQAN